MKKMFKKAVTWLMIVCTAIGFLPVFGAAAAVEETSVQASAWDSPQMSLSGVHAEGELEEIHSDSWFDLLMDVLKAFVTNLQSLSVGELLNLPANAMDDIVTYIFAVFKIFGINIDSLYEKISSIIISV